MHSIVEVKNLEILQKAQKTYALTVKIRNLAILMMAHKTNALYSRGQEL